MKKTLPSIRCWFTTLSGPCKEYICSSLPSAIGLEICAPSVLYLWVSRKCLFKKNKLKALWIAFWGLKRGLSDVQAFGSPREIRIFCGLTEDPEPVEIDHGLQSLPNQSLNNPYGLKTIISNTDGFVKSRHWCHCERSEAISFNVSSWIYEIASSLRSSQWQVKRLFTSSSILMHIKKWNWQFLWNARLSPMACD